MQTVTLLGATGSIGTSALDVIERHPDRYRLHALTAHSSVEKLLSLCLTHQPEHAVLGSEEDAAQLEAALKDHGISTRVSWGEQALCEVAGQADVVIAGIVGAAGLMPTLAAVRAGRRVLLANKEALVMSGALFMREVARSGAVLLPLDSEHNAIFQCLPREHRGGLDRHGITQLLLTASGGPFRDHDREALATVTPDQACAHPNWSMGRKISVDSATLMNKGLELIEACWLFDATPDQIDVVVHPQSVIHSMAAYSDGSVLAQMGNPDMRTPIAHALAWPERIDAGVRPLDLFAVARLDFQTPDLERFPCLRLAREAMMAGGTMPAVLNAANEIAVDAFLAGSIGFTDIPVVVETVMGRIERHNADELDVILAQDRLARHMAQDVIDALATTAAEG
ncbi:1-deoxy-D-xylulose-5-phosphate reductoisomerase [Kushneria phyllosphaerae]|uniref:1-deoxy-D-xylulose 5-phosphate reductoisomerase n=1 Tax=Kushneria phyllosphaerae TaxID=2100822 RepID=A0A2R8CMP9_9GAMM|nr:1-deoxy-D-xylulose-5-phosphate reductoisomerase [Kushneria phyllosphaerae]SPJ34176.1 1-deoxy-D-xylulose 5-phosphate reductoisomerase [Kushneria phyllosphaerae]